MGTIRIATVALLAGVGVLGAAVAGVEKALQEPAQATAAAVTVAPAPVARPSPAPPPSSVPPSVPVPPPCLPEAAACVQLSSASAWLRGPDGALLGPAPVSVGRADSPTPVGTFPVEIKRIDHVSSLDGTPMPFAVFFAGDYALYEGDLTQPSAGSVRLPPGVAAEYFGALEPGDTIQVLP